MGTGSCEGIDEIDGIDVEWYWFKKSQMDRELIIKIVRKAKDI